MGFERQLKTGDVSGNDYFVVKDGRYRGYFRVMRGRSNYLMASLTTLKNAPDGWVDEAAEYLRTNTDREVI